MDQTRFLQRVRMNQFKRVYDRWKHRKVTRKEAAEQLGIGERTFRRYAVRYSNEGTRGLLDRRPGEVLALYRDFYPQRNVAHFYEAYAERHGGKRSCSWVRAYRLRGAMERINSRIDNSFGFERHFIRGKAKMTARVGLAVAVMMALAVGHIKAGRPECMRSLVAGAGYYADTG